MECVYEYTEGRLCRGVALRLLLLLMAQMDLDVGHGIFNGRHCTVVQISRRSGSEMELIFEPLRSSRKQFSAKRPHFPAHCFLHCGHAADQAGLRVHHC